MCAGGSGSTACRTPKSGPRSGELNFSFETPLGIQPGDAASATPAAGRPRAPAGRQAQPDAPPPLEKKAATALLRALRANSLEQAAEALKTDPDAVESLFFDADFQTALNCAIEEHCCPDMVRLLLSHGADPAALDKRGRTALTVLSATMCGTIDTWPEGLGHSEIQPSLDAWRREVSREHKAWVLLVAAALLDAGADPEIPDGAGQMPAEVAEAAGNRWLARYWNVCRAARACAVLRREAAAPLHRGSAISRLMPTVVQEITEFLLPARACAW